MENEYGSDFITMSDEDGNEFELEHLDTLFYNGFTYMAFISADDDENADDDEAGLIILKVIVENEEELLSTIDDDDELDAVYDLFMERISEEDEED